MPKFFGAELPLSFGGNSIALTADLKQEIRYNLKNLILCSNGEKVSDKQFGVGARHYVFEFASEASKIAGKITSQVNKYMPYLTIKGVQSRIDESSNSMDLRVRYFIKPLNDSDELNIQVTALFVSTYSGQDNPYQANLFSSIVKNKEILGE